MIILAKHAGYYIPELKNQRSNGRSIPTNHTLRHLQETKTLTMNLPVFIQCQDHKMKITNTDSGTNVSMTNNKDALYD